MSRHPRKTAARRAQAGFTLIEIMIALLILGMGLGVLLRSASGNLAAARKAEMYAVVGELARAKMYDLEEQLLTDGFQQLDQEFDGDFEDEGWENITWEAKIVKIELPSLESLNAIGGADEEGEGEGGGGGAGILGSMLGFLPPGIGGGAAGGLDPSAAAGAAVLGSQYELISNVLEESIRKVTLTLKWKKGQFGGDMVFDCYFTDPAAIARALGGLPSGGESSGTAGTSGNSSGSTSSSTSSSDSMTSPNGRPNRRGTQ